MPQIDFVITRSWSLMEWKNANLFIKAFTDEAEAMTALVKLRMEDPKRWVYIKNTGITTVRVRNA